MALVPDDCYPWVSGGCNWTIAYLWHGWDSFARASVCLLALLALNILFITAQRFYFYFTARRQSRSFLHNATAALHDGRFNDVITISARSARSPTASIVVEGIQAFASVPPHFTDREALDAAERACRRVHAVAIAELASGLGTLRTVASLAPFIGLGGTCFGILFSFRAVEGERTTVMAYIALSIAQSLGITAFGLSVGILALWFHNHLWRRVEILGSQMLEAEADILIALESHSGWRHEREHTAEISRWGFIATETPQWEVPYDRQRALLVAVWGCGMVLAFVLFLHSC